MVSTRGAANAAGQAASNASSTTSSTAQRTRAARSTVTPPTATPAPAAPQAPATQPSAVTPQAPGQVDQAAIVAQLNAIATALGLQTVTADAASSHTDDEPEDEPDNDEANEPTAGAPGGSKASKNDRVDLRNIKVTPFDGVVPQGSFDSKACEFREELDEQMDDAQRLARQTWDDDVKKAVFKMHLTGMARRWYRDWRAANPSTTYEDDAAALEHEFRPVLLGVDVADRIKKERKKWNETYREYADRLLQMADALEGGKAVPANARHALVAFVRNAYPKYTDFLETKVDLDDDEPEATLKLAVSVLARKAETDGRMPDKFKTKTPPADHPTGKGKVKATPPQKKAKTTPKDAPSKSSKKRPAEANASIIERKKKPKTSHDKSQIMCYERRAPGHTADFCRKYLQGNKEGKFGLGAAQSAEVDLKVEQADDGNDQE
ncbi:hypothetical protein P43SY_000540 [Pythium insidiosum]|uniref:Retrotransposon gag domain-containing protein n=1 Tax=Pythium insidiosum TaxID=114742 RepID=A0AAD5LYW4_PYTIN|nr:hypothetical protein P43SY_000540 [Pythium insidiosum]